MPSERQITKFDPAQLDRVRSLERILLSFQGPDFYRNCLLAVEHAPTPQLRLAALRLFDIENWTVTTRSKKPKTEIIWNLPKKRVMAHLRRNFGSVLSTASDDPDPRVRGLAFEKTLDVALLVCRKTHVASRRILKDLAEISDNEPDPTTKAQKFYNLLRFVQDPYDVRTVYHPKTLARWWNERVDHLAASPTLDQTVWPLLIAVTSEKTPIFARTLAKRKSPFFDQPTVRRQIRWNSLHTQKTDVEVQTAMKFWAISLLYRFGD